ncbi:hypothetical protein AOLI_G00203220 [Acnodon oligacanthus]
MPLTLSKSTPDASAPSGRTGGAGLAALPPNLHRASGKLKRRQRVEASKARATGLLPAATQHRRGSLELKRRGALMRFVTHKRGASYVKQRQRREMEHFWGKRVRPIDASVRPGWNCSVDQINQTRLDGH